MKRDKTFVDHGDAENVETRIQYEMAKLPDIGNWLLEMATIGKDVYLCHREDCHKDGSISHYHYIELDQKQFLAMGGKELCPRTRETNE